MAGRLNTEQLQELGDALARDRLDADGKPAPSVGEGWLDEALASKDDAAAKDDAASTRRVA